jgi:hypothetical protein
MSKLLANRPSPKLEHLISINQTTFIKKRCIYDNFIDVQDVIWDLYRKNILFFLACLLYYESRLPLYLRHLTNQNNDLTNLLTNN